MHKRFHVDSIKRAGDDPFPSQVRDDAQNPPIVEDLEEPEYEVESILRARSAKRGRGIQTQALIKWAGWAEPSWEPIENIKETAALEQFENKYGPISNNDGPSEFQVGKFVGPAEQ